MCAILDNSVRDIVFGSNPTDAAKSFRKWVEDKKIPLVVGGHLKTELSGNKLVKVWLLEAARQGIVRLIDDGKVKAKTESLKQNSSCQSNDEHVIALAKVSGARLLYANDTKLEEDFLDKKLINKPKGVVYPKGNIKGGHHKWLHKHRDICNKGQ